MCETGLKVVLVLSLLIQGVILAAGALFYQAFDYYNNTSTNVGYYAFVLTASSISCILYFVLIPMSLQNKNVALPTFRILLLAVIVLQFAIATILSVMLRNQQTGYNTIIQTLENA